MPVDVPPLRGRDLERDLLRARIGSARQTGRGSIVVLSGSPGSGKSRLLQEVQALAVEADARLLHVAGDPDEALLPHTALLDAVQGGPDPLLDGRLLAGLPAGPEQGWWLRRELQSRLQQVAMQRPVVVCVDDTQWCGHGTLRILRTLPPQLATEAVVWVLTVRRGTSDPAVAATLRALRDAGADLVELRRLDDGAVALLIGDVLGALPDEDVLASAARAEGQPLLLVELLRGWQDEDLVHVEHGRATLLGHGLPARLCDAVRRRTERLSAPARELLQMGALLGRRFPPELLAALLDRPPPAVLAPLQEVVAASLLQDDGEQIGFEHDLIREAVLAAIPAAFARTLRRHAADVLRARGGSTLQVASLLAESAADGDLEAVTALREAASKLAPTASPAAATFSLRALELLPQHSPLRPEIVVEAIMHLWTCGRHVAAEQLAATMLTGATGAHSSAEARVRLALAQFTTNYSTPEAVRQCRTAMALPDLPDRLRLELQLWLATNYGLSGQPDQAEEVLAPTRRELADLPDPALQWTLARAEGYAAFHRQEWDVAFGWNDEVVRLSPVGEDMNPPSMWRATMWTSIGYPGRALSIIDPAVAAERRDDRMGALLMWSSFRARALFDAGRLEESQAEAEGVLEAEEVERVGGLMDLLVVHALVRGSLHARRTEVVRRLRHRVDRMVADELGQIRRLGLWLRALTADAAGDVAGALAAASEAIATLDRPGPSMSGLPDVADEVLLTRMALRGGAPDAALRAVEASERRSAANPGYVVTAAVSHHARGLLSGDEGHLREAVGLLHDTERPLLLASAREDLAGAVGADRPREAITLLDDALAAYTWAGAERDAARARRRLRELGVHRRRNSVLPVPSDHLATLTPTEREVVRLVAEGRTNAQVAAQMFVSPHTVNTHLRNAYVKLGVRSRLELARLVSEQGHQPTTRAERIDRGHVPLHRPSSADPRSTASPG